MHLRPPTEATKASTLTLRRPGPEGIQNLTFEKNARMSDLTSGKFVSPLLAAHTKIKVVKLQKHFVRMSFDVANKRACVI